MKALGVFLKLAARLLLIRSDRTKIQVRESNLKKMKAVAVIMMMYGSVVSAKNLSYQEAVQQMMSHNPALAQRSLQTEVSRKEWLSSKAAYLPHIDFQQTFTHSNNPVFVFGTLLNQRQFTEANFSIDALNHPDKISDISSRFQLSWLIYDFGRRENEIGSAEGGYRIASLEETSTRLALLQELIRRYYAVSLARQQLAVAENAIESAEARLEQAHNRVSQGLYVKSDELAANVYRAQRVQERIDAENQLQLAIASLYELLGVEEQEDITTAALEEHELPAFSFSNWQAEMNQHRPDLKVVSEAARIAQKQVAKQKSAFYPSLQAWSNYEFHGDSLSYSGKSWGVGLELQWNLFRGFSDSLQFSAAKLQQKAALEKQRETENASLLQLKKAYLDYQSAKEKLAVGLAAMHQAAESKRIYADRYGSGMVTIQDSLQAETSYNETQLMYIHDLYEMYVAYASLLAAAGKEEEMKIMGVQ
jgi:outer membrane protein TolC